MLCWLLCGLSCCSLLGGQSCCWRDGPPRWWRDGLALLLNDRRFRVRNGARRFHRLSSGRCTRNRGLVVVFCPFLDRTRIVLTHHREKRVGFLLGFDDTQAELKLRLSVVTSHELVYMQSIDRQQSFRRRTDPGRGRPQNDDEGTRTGSSRRSPRRSQ